ncbi:hypothetical protein XA68_17353 [Ophiocordyceps unilateralis]|uniref:Methyltransferase domain-containing protein n=1 Tax=Ophiocordyceps unilateralis TaxID=268505 RepID=A0A2A9PJ98_OPHUN|nr:hypothetical protein XA68_17353 [Ophiocordyceps unilateralis]
MSVLLPSSASSPSTSSTSPPATTAFATGGGGRPIPQSLVPPNGPSLALAEVLGQRPDLVPPPPPPTAPSSSSSSPAPRRRATALVPGCGLGHDALLLASFGYDVWGLDVVERNRSALGRLYPPVREAVGCGSVTWLVADFLADDWSLGLGFDLIFDYSFLCALSPTHRPRWAKRVAQLMVPGGRLVCLEYPSSKPMSEPGPPWGVSPELYEALLSAPGEAPAYRPDGTVVADPIAQPRHDALHRLGIIKPTRTHDAGTGPDGSVLDFISVWTR